MEDFRKKINDLINDNRDAQAVDSVLMKLEETILILGREVDVSQQRIAELEAEVGRLEKAIRHCDPLCPAWAALEGK